MISLTYEIFLKNTNELTYKNQKSTHTYKTNLWFSKGTEEDGGGINRCLELTYEPLAGS